VTVVNCTFSDNRNETGDGGTPGLGGAIYLGAGTLAIKNSILWTNVVKDGVSGSEIYADSANSRIEVSYSDMTGTNTPHVVAAGGATATFANTITEDPLYASATDLHLQSQRGRWDPATSAFVTDAETSPCIDGGDDTDDVGDETAPHGNTINMGAYGGTAEASKTYAPPGVLIIIR